MDKVEEFISTFSDKELSEITALSDAQKNAIVLSELKTVKGFNNIFNQLGLDESIKIFNRLEKHIEKVKLKIEKEKEQKKETEKKAKSIVRKLEKLIEDEGLDISVNELLNDYSKGKSINSSKPTKKAKILYALKDDSGMIIKEWSGRGIQPVAIREYIENGGSLEDLKIDSEGS